MPKRLQMEYNLTKESKAFTLMEILIVVAIIGFMVAIVPKWLYKKDTKSDISAVLDQVNNLVSIARQEAISKHKIVRLVFQSSKKELDKIWIEQEESDSKKPGQKIYKEIPKSYFETRYILPESVKIRAIYQNKKEQLEENKGRAYCYIVTTGLIQDVLIHIVKKNKEGFENKYTFKMEPFMGKFELFEDFIKPK